ncbi:MAG TPA: 23S rRNA (pseudouridine(1915)-N(3))-methyltransferase RlmH [Roseiarcus sp.]|nr:23S rRNA (pseudouridine(1915)-N(3))-methyltransferase RlmH [Roseiarcus sp.]
MRLLFVAVGRLKAGPERQLFERYAKRLVDMARAVGIGGVDFRELDEGRARRPEDRQNEEARAIRAILPEGARIVLCDERGKSLASAGFAADIAAARDSGETAYVLVIGGPDGLDANLRAEAKRVIAFGAMTWPHQLARIMAAEQAYRALTILAGHPYHRL